MKKPYDFKKEWPRIKYELVRVGQEAIDLAKKGEKELIKLSKQGKCHIDVATLRMKREHILYQVGKEYVHSGFAKTQSRSMKKLIESFKKIEQDIASVEKKLKEESK